MVATLSLIFCSGVFEAMNFTFVQPLLRVLFSQFRHSFASLICETTTDRVGKNSGSIELFLLPKSYKKKENQPAKLKIRKGDLDKNKGIKKQEK